MITLEPVLASALAAGAEPPSFELNTLMGPQGG
jgi:hypothetical protein